MPDVINGSYSICHQAFLIFVYLIDAFVLSVIILFDEVGVKKTTVRGNLMKLMIIRHADPDYTIDSLTEKGLLPFV